MINIGQYIEMAINWLTEHFASFFDALSMGIGYYNRSIGCACLVQVGQRNGPLYSFGLIINLWYGLLGRNDADTGISAFFHLSGIAFRGAVGDLDCQQ